MTRFLKSPIALILSFAIAIIISQHFPWLGQSMEIPAGMYLAVLQMCVIPLLISSLVRACAAIVSDESFSSHSILFVSWQTVFAFALASITVMIVCLSPVGPYLAQTGQLIQFATFENGLKPLYTTMTGEFITQTSIMDIVRTIFTNNIFDSLSKSVVMQIIFFAILVGCAAGTLAGKQKETFTHFVSGVESVFKTIIGWVTLLLPIGVVFVFSFEFHKMSESKIIFLLPAITFNIACMLVLLLIFHIVLAKQLGKGFVELWRDMKAPLVVAFSTGSIIASLPSYLQALTQSLRLDERFSLLYGPLSLALYRFGNVFYYAFFSVMMAQVFSVPLALHDYFIIAMLSFFLSFAAVSSNLVNVGLIALILVYINVPSTLPVVLLGAVDPLIAPIRSAFSVYLNIFGLCIFVQGDKKRLLSKEFSARTT